jgi:excisionase family DNA binding protein
MLLRGSGSSSTVAMAAEPSPPPARPLLCAAVSGFPAVFVASLLRDHGGDRLRPVAALVEAGRLPSEVIAEVRAAWAAIDAAADGWRAWAGSVSGTAEPGVAEPAACSAVMSVEEVASMVGMSERGVRKMIARGELSARKSGRAWLVDRGSVEMARAARGAA